MIYEQLENLCKRITALQKRSVGIQAEIQTNPGEDRRVKLYSRALANVEAIEDLKHEMHCLAVVAGIADHNPKRYGVLTIAGPLGPRKVTRRDPFAENTEDILLPASVDNPALDDVYLRVVTPEEIEQRREELKQIFKVEEDLRGHEMQNRAAWAYEQLKAFNEKYPPNE